MFETRDSLFPVRFSAFCGFLSASLPSTILLCCHPEPRRTGFVRRSRRTPTRLSSCYSFLRGGRPAKAAQDNNLEFVFSPERRAQAKSGHSGINVRSNSQKEIRAIS